MALLTREHRKESNGARQELPHVLPAANIVEQKEGYVLELEMPGVNKSGLEITVQDNELVIVGRRSDAEVKGELIHRESRPANYRRVFELDPSINVGNISARMDQGILRLTLPKAESVKPKKISVT